MASAPAVVLAVLFDLLAIAGVALLVGAARSKPPRPSLGVSGALFVLVGAPVGTLMTMALFRDKSGHKTKAAMLRRGLAQDGSPVCTTPTSGIADQAACDAACKGMKLAGGVMNPLGVPVGCLCNSHCGGNTQ